MILENPIDGPDHIDPMCFIDDNDEAYLYWGFGRPGTPYVAKLKKNMIELAERPKVVDYGSNDLKLLFYTNIKINITFHIINSVQAKLVMVLEVHLMDLLKIWEYLLMPLVVRSLIQE